jgi:hypothetical protein
LEKLTAETVPDTPLSPISAPIFENVTIQANQRLEPNFLLDKKSRLGLQCEQ